MIELEREEYNALPKSLRGELARTLREHWGMFYDSEWAENDRDLEVIEDSVFKSVLFRWLAGNYEIH